MAFVASTKSGAKFVPSSNGYLGYGVRTPAITGFVGDANAAGSHAPTTGQLWPRGAVR